MNPVLVNADRGSAAIADGVALPWIPSPETGVHRRVLERIGGEIALATSIVRYQTGSRFPLHVHTQGEEFFVLDGIFADEAGVYPKGTYVRNPPGSAHAPFSKEGCTLFVKLRQMEPDETEFVRIHRDDRSWESGYATGHETATLYSNSRILVTLERLQAGTTLPPRKIESGEEILVVGGTIDIGAHAGRRLGLWSWYRHPGNTHAALHTSAGAMLWVKRGHLAP